MGGATVVVLSSLHVRLKSPNALWRLTLSYRQAVKRRTRSFSEELVSHIFGQIDADLRVKEQKGILKSMASRAAFLSDASHHIRFVYIPKHTSWLNQIECWFSILVRRLLRRASFYSTVQLSDRILAFIDYFNRTMSKPFQWKYKGCKKVE